MGKAAVLAHCHPLFIPSTSFWGCCSKGLKGFNCDEFTLCAGGGGGGGAAA